LGHPPGNLQRKIAGVPFKADRGRIWPFAGLGRKFAGGRQQRRIGALLAPKNTLGRQSLELLLLFAFGLA